MPEVATHDNQTKRHTATPVIAIIVVGLFLLALLYLGLSRYYNALELQSLVEGAEAKGQNYSIIIHSGLTGSYSFTIN